MKINSIAVDWPWWQFAIGYKIYHGTTTGLMLYLGPVIIALDFRSSNVRGHAG